MTEVVAPRGTRSRATERLLALGLMAASALGCSDSRPDALVLITVDTLRADHLGTYGYSRDTSPWIDALAERGVVFEQTYAALPETTPAFSSMMTGRWPAELDVRSNRATLGPAADTLAERLSAEGFATAAFVSGFPLVARLSGLDQGFSHYDDAMPDPRGRIPAVQRLASKTTDAVLDWVRAIDDRPVFLWVHYYDPHGDYAPGAPYDTMFASDAPGPAIPPGRLPAYQDLGSVDSAAYVAWYDGEIRRTDDEIRRLVDGLRALSPFDDALIAVTSDHGESLTEHDYFFDHGKEVYAQSLHIPWIVAGPGVPADGRRIGGIARTPDIAPTLLELLGLPVSDAVPGRSLVEAIRTGSPVAGQEAFSEARFAHRRAQAAYSRVGPKVAARDDRFTAILRLEGDTVELFDRATDPGEEHNLLDGVDGAPFGAALRARLAAVRAGEPEPRVFDTANRALAERLAADRP